LEDLLALMERLAFPEHWNLVHTRKVLDSAFRLVVPAVDSEVGEKGYAFVHPLLGDHFRTELKTIKEERYAIPRAYLNWGAAVVATLNAGNLPPEQCPAYLLRHYVDHVLAADLDPDEELDRYLLPLLGQGWHRAWHEEEGAYGGYLADIRRIQDQLHKADTNDAGPLRYLGQTLRCALIRSSIHSRMEKIPAELILALVEAGEWSVQRAMRVTAQLADPEVRAQAYSKLARQLQGERRRQCLHQALVTATNIGDEWSRAYALMAMIGQLEGEEHRQCLRQALVANRYWQ